ncbi:glycoside hydrolase family 28 protein [Terriglobus roseus]|uniref:Glycosyl hydrolases family 28 n=1 Tax=Terriglobus roseus TaxID=392734 RepID=A0A1H4TTK1_9BACT|nr:glycoside hydrolase family 28 protein [Terriglobus roseus]SEC59570.1 Glycosyl hydrolases family 28 [Terriglobus roseus]
MNPTTTTARRTFLKTAGASLLAMPLLAEAMDAHAKPAPAAGTNHNVQINVRDMGATGDGRTKDTLALQQALDRCALLGGGEVLVPAGDYLTGALQIRSNTTLHLAEGATLNGASELSEYPISQVRWEGKFIKGYLAFLYAIDAENIRIVGPGRIVGSPAIVGRVQKETRMRLPALMEFVSCRNVIVENCYTKQYGMWSIHPLFCENVTFRNVQVDSGADGIDVDSCKQVVIEGCNFQTADDCISLKSGRGSEANRIARPCEDVRISNCTFADTRWACIGIGSEASAGVRNVLVEHCKCTTAYTHAFYIKTRPGRGAYIENLTFNDIDVSGVREGFLRINDLNSGLQDQDPVPGDEGLPMLRNLRFTNIRVSDVPQLVAATEIHPKKPLEGLIFENITGTARKGMLMANINGLVLKNIHVTGIEGPLLSTVNVHGKGIEGAVPLPAASTAKIPEPIAAPVTPYVLR